MNPGAPTPQKSSIVYDILAYLVDHPDAQDTIEGIVEWWLLEQRIKQATTQVNTALAQLTAEELVIPREGHTGQVLYRANRKKMQEIRRLLRQEGKKIKG